MSPRSGIGGQSLTCRATSRPACTWPKSTRAKGKTGEAEALLLPVLSSRDPEVRWRLADVLISQGRFDEGERQLGVARSRYEELLGKHLLAFADHGAEFYAGSGNDRRRALGLARANAANRPTPRAVEQARAIASRNDKVASASDRLSAAPCRSP